MKFTELINSNFSRKAEIVIVTIVALVYIGTFQSDQGKVIDHKIIVYAICGVIWIGTLGIITQALIDWKKSGQEIKGVLPEIPDEEIPIMPRPEEMSETKPVAKE